MATYFYHLVFHVCAKTLASHRFVILILMESQKPILLLQIFNASEELDAASQYKEIRLFTVAMKYSAVRLQDLVAVAEPWSLPNASGLAHQTLL